MKTIKDHEKKSRQVEITNKWVVPYNPFLLIQFKCHINVELCSSVKSIKFVLKYITKGSDQAVFQLQENEQDEIAMYQSARYVSSTEAAWRIFEHPIHEHFPPVIPLDVHLEGGQRVLFDESNVVEKAQGGAPATTPPYLGREACKKELAALGNQKLPT